MSFDPLLSIKSILDPSSFFYKKKKFVENFSVVLLTKCVIRPNVCLVIALQPNCFQSAEKMHSNWKLLQALKAKKNCTLLIWCPQFMEIFRLPSLFATRCHCYMQCSVKLSVQALLWSCIVCWEMCAVVITKGFGHFWNVGKSELHDGFISDCMCPFGFENAIVAKLALPFSNVPHRHVDPPPQPMNEETYFQKQGQGHQCLGLYVAKSDMVCVNSWTRPGKYLQEDHVPDATW